MLGEKFLLKLLSPYLFFKAECSLSLCKFRVLGRLLIITFYVEFYSTLISDLVQMCFEFIKIHFADYFLSVKLWFTNSYPLRFISFGSLETPFPPCLELPFAASGLFFMLKFNLSESGYSSAGS